MRLATQTRVEADDAVGSLVNRMIELCEAADWFCDPTLRQPAIDESLRYVIFDSEVPADALKRHGNLHGPDVGIPRSSDHRR